MIHEEQNLDKVFTALSNEKRRAILHELSQRPASISQLAEISQQSLQAIHKHLAVLEEAELIIRKKSGRTNFIAINATSLTVAQQWIKKYHTHWSSTQATLENYIQNLPD